ncbi:hypothetical protein C8C83_2809 [Flavobacterium sp. 90]|uniref:hypothetical protein n=1 Tax=unclassified Flavobacterium TaxID=196869 RepID=UPI000EB3876F|nr:MULTISPECIES: hypothetical protein [unclassified Flavobacterium]RKR11111.1 hypothetical protein C8C82_3117 [Flavobacterium sp. 81]TCK54894.1 hypothetical protein C8C83_2809 [Flavobacterium sp. 90]
MDYVLVNRGLGKPFWKKIRIKDVSLKNAVKVTKGLIPIATSIIPVVGPAGSGILSKVLKNSNGSASFVGRIADKATILSKTTAGKAIVNTIKSTARPQVQSVNALKPAPVVTNPTSNTAGQDDQPVGDLTPVTPATASELLQSPKKDNTALYAVGAVAVLGGIYLATKNS